MCNPVVSKPRALRAGVRASVSAAALISAALLLLLALLVTRAPSLYGAASSAARFDAIGTPVRHDWPSSSRAARADDDECAPLFKKLATHGMLCGARARARSCKRHPDWKSLKLGAVWLFSQFGQDAYLFTRHFTHLRRPGVYVDVASNAPKRLSNSFFFDRCLRWKGVCVEANGMYHEPTFRERSCLLVPTCAGATDGERVSFVLDGELGGVAGKSYKFGKGSSNQTRVDMRCTALRTVLRRAGVRRVDFLSLDVEGHELQVLKGVDWHTTRIDVISVEVTPSFDDVQRMLLGLGYVRHVVGKESEISPIGKGFLGMDAIFLRSDVTLGEPN